MTRSVSIALLQGTTHRHPKNRRKTSSTYLGDSINFTTSDHELVGREESLHQLKDAYERIRVSQSELVLVHGISGSGKSSLINAFVRESVVEQEVLFVSGKFDQLLSHAPFAALVTASNQLCRDILRRVNSEAIRDRIRAELGPEINLLGNLIPALAKMAENRGATKKASSMGGQAFSRFKQLFRSFMRAAASDETPIILFLDDIQWADAASLEVLKALLTDDISKHILIILAFRDDEMQSDKLLKYTSQKSLDNDDGEGDSEPPYHAPITDIAIKSLDIDLLNQLISSVMNLHPDLSRPLSSLILNKTDGNPYHALNFLEMLHTTQLLTRNDAGQWDWSEEKILAHTDVSDNLAAILEAKILRLPEQVRSILQLASFIGHDFSTDVLVSIVYEEQDMIETDYSFERSPREEIEKRIRSAISFALAEGLLETTVVENTVKFSHDRIQSCLYEDLVPDEVERRLLHQRIGRLIWKTVKEKGVSTVDEWVIFLAADNLNRGVDFLGESNESGERYELMELNLTAAKLATNKAAFLVAVEYLRVALGLMEGKPSWDKHYDLCIDLHNTAAEIERTIGCYGRSHALVNKIHKYAKSIEHQFPAYLIEVNSLASNGKLEEAMKLGFGALRQLGVSFSKKISKGSVVRELLWTAVALGNRSHDDLLELPVLQDQKIMFALQCLSVIAVNSFIVGDSANDIFTVVSLRMVRLTVQYGLSELYTPVALVAYGSVLVGLGNYDSAIKYEEVAMKLLKKFDAESAEGKTLIFSYSTIHTWRYRLDHNLHNDFLRLYHVAMNFGDVDHAYFGILGWMLTGFHLDVPLIGIVKRARAIVADIKECDSRRSLMFLTPTLQTVSLDAFQNIDIPKAPYANIL